MINIIPSDSNQLFLRHFQTFVDSFINENLSSSEKQSIKAIELLRKETESSTEAIEILNYGTSKRKPRSLVESEHGWISNSTVGAVCKRGSKNRLWGRFLMQLIGYMSPHLCLELGTCVGISAAYQATSLAKIGGKLVTIEGSPTLVKIAKKNIEILKLSDYVYFVTGSFQSTLSIVLDKYKIFDYVFIDGHHDETATCQYFEQIYPYLSTNAIVVFDDINWSEGMKKVWKKIYEDPRINVSIDFEDIGICLFCSNFTSEKFHTVIPKSNLR
ncbi:MAG: class I SAM-dependent methyltransferase [Okeania sp. SIO1H6]|nr:class I SAM-dependent methyltransferase [Okeania sp. SIO1H6]